MDNASTYRRMVLPHSGVQLAGAVELQHGLILLSFVVAPIVKCKRPSRREREFGDEDLPRFAVLGRFHPVAFPQFFPEETQGVLLDLVPNAGRANCEQRPTIFRDLYFPVQNTS